MAKEMESTGDMVELTQGATVPATRGIYVGAGGSLNVRTRDGQDIAITEVLTGAVLPFRIIRWSAGGTASNIIGLY